MWNQPGVPRLVEGTTLGWGCHSAGAGVKKGLPGAGGTVLPPPHTLRCRCPRLCLYAAPSPSEPAGARSPVPGQQPQRRPGRRGRAAELPRSG